MLFYTKHTTEKEKEYYSEMLEMIGSLSNLFSDSLKPYLASRVTENLFCTCLSAENLSRGDVTADARKDNIGIGIKTWVDSNVQKIAEFNSLKPQYENDSDEIMIKKISMFRNERIDFTMRTYALSDMVYHCTVRDIGKIHIGECPLVKIDINSIHNINRKKNIISFDDSIGHYSFNTSKSTLYKRFDNLSFFKTIDVKIIENPLDVLAEKMGYILPAIEPSHNSKGKDVFLQSAFLPLYSTTRGDEPIKYVPERNNLNIRFASGRKRNLYELGIPIPAAFRKKYSDFFPGVGNPFKLILPNGKELTASQCQQDGKSLMSNPNKELGHWLIDDVLKIDPNIVISYDMLSQYGVDSVRVDKYKSIETNEIYYYINFAITGSYEKFMNNQE